ncbi:MAG: hypothetical protein P4L64_04305 [Caulobacteraceae bacterium]|nr:hypothetical protein [Caulobacteraceae bacterium]
MSNLSDSQTTILRSIFSSAPDSAVASLESALSGEVERGGPMAAVHALVAREAVERRLRSLIFAPLAPLCKNHGGPYPRFSSKVLTLLCQALRETTPAGIRAAEAIGPLEDEEDRIYAAGVFDNLCRIAARGLRNDTPAFAAARALLEGAEADGVEKFLHYLDLTPLARGALNHLPDWLGRLTNERAVAIRIAYKDAVDVAEDDGPRLLDILCAHMGEPWKVLHLISAIMDRPTDRFAAGSEVARFGEYFMDDIDQRLNQFRNFDLDGGRAGGMAAAANLHTASLEIAEFEGSLELSRDGLWGARVARQKQSLAQLAETRLAQIDKAVDKALPLLLVKFGKGLRGFPKLTEDPQPMMLRRAESLLAFYEQSRAGANQSGYGSARAKAGERLDERLDQYVEDLLEMRRGDEVENMDRVRRYLEAAAQLIGVAKGDKAAQLVRRRAAA